MDEATLAVGSVVGDRYGVEQLVGLGGLAEVYRVRHLELGSLHALKLLTWNRKSLTERLLLEGRIQAQLTHPHIVRVTDVVRVEQRIGLLLEFIEGPSLEDFLDHHGALSVPDALGLFAPVLAAVAHAHDAGVLHRDIKPANVLLMRAPGGWVPKVTDFGLAKVVEEGLGPNTRTGISMGTPGYMPPEQIRDSASADVRTDIFALGSVLYEMLSGRKAFAPPDGSQIEVTATIERTPSPLTELPPALWAAIASALEPDRELRYTDARAFAAALGIGDHPSLSASPDLIRVPLALDPSTYPSNPSSPTREPPAAATLGPQTSAVDRAPTVSGRVAVAAIFGSVLLAVAVVALMTQPVLESRRARQAAQAEGLLPTEPLDRAVEEPIPSPVAAEPVLGEAMVAPPGDPPVVEEPAEPPVEDPEPGEDTGEAVAAFDEADEDPPSQEVDAAEEAPKVAASGVEEPAIEAAPGPTLPLGTYRGEADRRPFELRVSASTGGRVVAEALFYAGGPLPRVEPLEGTFEPATGRLELTSPTSRLVFEGRRRGDRIEGEYRRGSRPQPFSVALP